MDSSVDTDYSEQHTTEQLLNKIYTFGFDFHKKRLFVNHI